MVDGIDKICKQKAKTKSPYVTSLLEAQVTSNNNGWWKKKTITQLLPPDFYTTNSRTY